LVSRKNHKAYDSPVRPGSSPVKKPLKRKKRGSNTSVLTKLFLVGFCCCALVFLVDNKNGLDNSIKTPPNDGSTNSEHGQLRLRPAYLTDDGKQDADDGYDDGGNEEEESGDGSDEGDEENEEEGEDGSDAEDDENNNGGTKAWGDTNDDTVEDIGGVDSQKEESNNKDSESEEEGEDTGFNIKNAEGIEQKVRHRLPFNDRKGQNHKIPRILIFTHYKNLLELGENKHTDNAAPDANVYQNLTSDELEELTLAANVQHSIDIHNRVSSGEGDRDPEVLFWTDKDCIESLLRTQPNLVPYFKNETEGMYKADICRGTALLEHGGFYLDVDVGIRHDLWRDLRPDTEFVTARVHHASNWVNKGFFQAILGASPQNPVLKRYLELFQQHYDGINRVQKGPLGVLLLHRAWEQIRSERRENSHGMQNIATELYQEFLFVKDGPFDSGNNRGVLSPAPTWGKRRACHFLVAGIANDPSNIEIVLESNKNDESGDEAMKKTAIGLQIPVLSRIPGSRMCIDGDGDRVSDKTQLMESMKWWERT